MFCENCGSPVAPEHNFCRGCGRPLRRPAEGPPAAAPAAPVQHAGRCSWCGAAVDASLAACPQCGGVLSAPAGTTRSGWTQLPPRKDMAKLQFGNSTCQVEGLYVPVADMNLAEGDSVYFTHHVLLWKDPQVNITIMSLKGAWSRAFAGLPIVMTQAEGPGHIAFSKDEPGELISLPLHPGQSVDVREHLLLTATSNIAYDWFNTGIWFQTGSGDDAETHYPVGHYMDRFTAQQSPGLLLVHAAGNILVRELAPGRTILVKPSALVFKDPTVAMQLHLEHPRDGIRLWRSWSNRYLWLRLRGPGRVAVQSVFQRIEGDAAAMTGCSAATSARW